MIQVSDTLQLVVVGEQIQPLSGTRAEMSDTLQLVAVVPQIQLFSGT